MRIFIGFIFVGVVSFMGCASMTVNLAPKNIRQKEYVEKTTLKKELAFERVAEYFAKVFNDVNSVIKLNDKNLSKIILKGNTSCDALKLGNGFSNNQRIEFTLTFEAKDNKARFLFEDLVAESSGGWDSGGRPTNQAEVIHVAKECIDPMVKSLLDNINENKKQW